MAAPTADTHQPDSFQSPFDGASQGAQCGMHSRNADGTIWTPGHRRGQTAGNSRPMAVIDKMPQNTDAITGDIIGASPMINTISTGQQLHREKYSTDIGQNDADNTHENSTDSSTSSSENSDNDSRNSDSSIESSILDNSDSTISSNTDCYTSSGSDSDDQ